ncbi:uncharacterized protein LOC142325234 isoform X2 [Lycorma delicatula]|uniref:uncharacterized protein LOC142325234 isoform X2 n=1 Tax=Lycorma delicatula TaxID=130591 RepID=UPI003F5111BE
MDVLYYYEYLLMQKFKEGVILIEEPLKYRSEVYGDVENNCELSGNDKQIRTPILTLLIILIKKKEDKRMDKKLACCQLQLACHWYKYNKSLLAKYDYFCSDETIIVYNKNDYKVKYKLFRCTNVKILSLKHNFMTSLPADIGRMRNLEHLILTNNLLTVKAIPQTLTFCSSLTHLFLDNNHFDALPGFLLDMAHLKTVRRHGNHNYFKSTFIWYHHNLNERVLKVNDEKKLAQTIFQPPSLEMLAIQSVISARDNFFRPGYLPDTLQDYIALVFNQFNICGFCNSAKPLSHLGYKVFTFKSPYLGNTCVPFLHWACSRECGEEIEIPARHAQQRAARKMDEMYEQYITAIQRDHKIIPPDKSQCTIF